MWYWFLPELSCLHTFSSHFGTETSGLLQIPDCHLRLSYIWCSHSQETDTGSYICRWPEFGAEWICVTSQGCPRPSVTSEKAQSFQAQFPQLCNNDTMSISWESAKTPSLEPCLASRQWCTVGTLWWLYIVFMLPSPELDWKPENTEVHWL